MKKLGLNPDEIRIKLDQNQWNELPTQKDAPNKRYLGCQRQINVV